MKKYYIILILTLTVKLCTAQQNTHITELARFIISDVRLNNADVTKEYLDANAYLVFYRINGNEQIYFAGVWPKKGSQSYGRIYNVETTQNVGTQTEYRNETISFKWSYANSYDNKVGTASVILGLVYKPNGTAFVLTMTTETLDESVYRGYLSGSLDLSN